VLAVRPAAAGEELARGAAPAGLPALTDAEGWGQLVDSTWGEGRPTAEKLMLFDTFWSAVDREFPSFGGLAVDWDELRARYRAEVAAGVSKGRFAAILSRLSLALMEAHTSAVDRVVFWRTETSPGVPLLVVGGWGQANELGACLTALPDRTALVYDAPADHPFGLRPGDVVLGFDGRPWHELWPEMLELGLPVTGIWGSCPESYEHAWVMAAGANWHLFDTIDIRRHASGEVDHLPTSLMVDYRHQPWCTEQLPVGGVPMPDFAHAEVASWGVVEGTRVAYVYVWGWGWEAEQEFHDAIAGAMAEPGIVGLIVDFRFNLGGNMHLSNAGLALLFDRVVPTIDWLTRCDPDDHLALCNEGIWPSYVIPGDPATVWDRPIAVLVGPGAVSSGDQVALRMAFHPEARLFGRSTNAAFTAAALTFSDTEWQATHAVADAHLLSDPGVGLTHRPLAVDVPVWLTPDDVAAGRDTVVLEALRWIREAAGGPRRPAGRVMPP
jgi:hypothetical protein